MNLKFKFSLLIILLGCVQLTNAQNSGVYGGPSIRKPLFIADSLTKGNPNFGFGLGIGLIPGQHEYKFTIDFNYLFKTKDSVLVSVQENNCWTCYSGLTDAAQVTVSGFSVGINYGITIKQKIHPMLNLTIALNMNGTFNKLEYSYTSDTKYMTIDSLLKDGDLYVGPEFSAYYDMGKYHLFGSALLNFGIVGGAGEPSKPWFKMSAPFLFGLNLGICYKLGKKY